MRCGRERRRRSGRRLLAQCWWMRPSASLGVAEPGNVRQATIGLKAHKHALCASRALNIAPALLTRRHSSGCVSQRLAWRSGRGRRAGDGRRDHRNRTPPAYIILYPSASLFSSQPREICHAGRCKSASTVENSARDTLSCSLESMATANQARKCRDAFLYVTACRFFL